MAVRMMLPVYALTLFASAALLFVLEPLVGKIILPRLGGSPAVWNICVFFFQTVLLVGYAYAHVSTTCLGVRRQALLHLALVGAGLVFLLATPSPLWLYEDVLHQAAEQPWLALLAGLSVSYGLPLFLVCSSAPLLQKWLSDTAHPAAHDPYFLYGASNLGSMLALLSYPTLLEPHLHLLQQRWLWLGGYGLLLLLTGLCACLLWSFPPDPSLGKEARLAEQGSSEEEGLEVPIARRLRWLVLAFVPSSLMLGVTAWITTDVAAIPLLWVLPLGLYLLSFILAFSRIPSLVHRILVLALPPLLLALLVMMLSDVTPRSLAATIGFHLLVLFVAAMVCHGELARDRPSTRYLTGYFLWISVGGSAGGLFNSLLAPLLFRSLAEYPLMLVLACFLVPPQVPAQSLRRRKVRDGGLALIFLLALIIGGMHFSHHGRYDPTLTTHLLSRFWTLEGVGLVLLIGVGLAGILYTPADRRTAWLDLLLALSLGGLALELTWGKAIVEAQGPALLILFGLPACLCYAAFMDRSFRFGLGAGFFVLAILVSTNARQNYLLLERSFFGVLTVGEWTEIPDWEHREKVLCSHYLKHGTTLHGMQIIRDNRGVREDLQDIPLTYYHRTGPAGQLFKACNTDAQKSLGVIGLGVGALACYALPGQHLTFYEIDPLIRDLALDSPYFTYVRRAAQRDAKIDLILGDARVQMTQVRLTGADRYAILVVDAFSSDAIPIHLITREAIQVYLDHLADDGVLAFHITNRHLNLEPVLANLAQDLHLTARIQYDTTLHSGKNASVWAVLVRHPEHLRLAEASHCWRPLQPAPRVGVWTDDYSNVMSVLKNTIGANPVR